MQSPSNLNIQQTPDPEFQRINSSASVASNHYNGNTQQVLISNLKHFQIQFFSFKFNIFIANYFLADT